MANPEIDNYVQSPEQQRIADLVLRESIYEQRIADLTAERDRLQAMSDQMNAYNAPNTGGYEDIDQAIERLRGETALMEDEALDGTSLASDIRLLIQSIAEMAAERDRLQDEINNLRRSVLTELSGEEKTIGIYDPCGVLSKCREVRRERDRLQTVVEKLSKTADGVVVVPGIDVIYVIDDHGIIWSCTAEWSEYRRCFMSNRGYAREIEYCYSTSEAAEQAKGNNP